MMLRSIRCNWRRIISRHRLICTRRLSSWGDHDQTRFSCYMSLKDQPDDLLRKLKDNTALKNPRGHNAAVLLASPVFAKYLTSEDFTSELTQLLSASPSVKEFHLLCAIVDNVAPALGEPVPTPAISVLRGELDAVLPRLWQTDLPQRQLEDDALAALTFNVGLSAQTLPLARTTFLNNRTSTLLASRYDLSDGNPRLEDRIEKQWQSIYIAIDRPVQSIADVGLWAPLAPVTRARRITESFGNIVRAVEVDGESTPASTELEDAVNRMLQQEPIGEHSPRPSRVWAFVTPKHSSSQSWSATAAPDPSKTLECKSLDGGDLDANADYLQKQHRAGSRFYQVLSGGGGWGAKKGLLSLDPQESYFATTGEDELERFMQSMSKSSIAPPGDHVQFFVPANISSESIPTSVNGIVFGVDTSLDSGEAGDVGSKSFLVADHFGALSREGVYLSVSHDAASQTPRQSKVSVPGSRLFVGQDAAKSDGLLGVLGGDGLADTGTLLMM